MPIKNSFKEMQLGPIMNSLASFAKSSEIEMRLKDMLNIAIVSLGQGGGRKGAEIAKFGWDIWMVNSATIDMTEHEWINEKRKIVLTDPERGKLEGTAKNARIGHEIAQKNVQRFKEIAVETQDADLVIVTVALGGGQGNGAIKTALDWIIKVREMSGLVTEKGNPTIMVIPSIPARDESNPDIWRNALSGIKLLQEYVNEKKVGSILPIDNEFIRTYYNRQKPLEHNGRQLTALDYSNLILARTLFEALTIPLLGGQVSMDSAELLEILTTPGWLTLNRKTIDGEHDFNLNTDIQDLFLKNEVFSTLELKNTLAGGIALITNRHKPIQPQIIDSIKPITSKTLGQPAIMHSAVIQSNYAREATYLIGLAISPTFPESTVDALLVKFDEEQKRKEEKEALGRQMNSKLAGFDDVFASREETAATGKRKISLEDLEIGVEEKPERKRVSLSDL